jgi:hypothetical protein
MSSTKALNAATAPGPDQRIPGVVVMAADASGIDPALLGLTGR